MIMDYQKLHFSSAVFDAHVDTLLRVRDRGIDLGQRNTTIYLDIPRAREGGVNHIGFAVWVDPVRFQGEQGFIRANELIDALYSQIAKYPRDLALARNSNEAGTICSEKKIAAFLGIEGGHFISSTEMLDPFYQRGVRYLSLCWSKTHDWADSAEDAPRWNGLTEYGVQVVREMENLGMLVDLSHSSDRVVEQVFDMATKPVIFSHSCCRSIVNHYRNVTDEMLRKLAQNGGVIGISFYARFLRKEQGSSSRVAIQDLIDHIDHAVQVAGIDHVGLGSDYDGARDYPIDLDDISCLPHITRELCIRGYHERDIKKILGDNFLRVFSFHS
jgi:membrane dipeptidase